MAGSYICLIQLHRWFDEFRALCITKNSCLFRKLARSNEGGKWRGEEEIASGKNSIHVHSKHSYCGKLPSVWTWRTSVAGLLLCTRWCPNWCDETADCTFDGPRAILVHEQHSATPAVYMRNLIRCGQAQDRICHSEYLRFDEHTSALCTHPSEFLEPVEHLQKSRPNASGTFQSLCLWIVQ